MNRSSFPTAAAVFSLRPWRRWLGSGERSALLCGRAPPGHIKMGSELPDWKLGPCSPGQWTLDEKDNKRMCTHLHGQVHMELMSLWKRLESGSAPHQPSDLGQTTAPSQV